MAAEASNSGAHLASQPVSKAATCREAGQQREGVFCAAPRQGVAGDGLGCYSVESMSATW
jgi:hypothetical protein